MILKKYFLTPGRNFLECKSCMGSNSAIESKPLKLLAVSLGAKVLVADFFCRLQSVAETQGFEIECCLLDVPEVANLQHLTELGESEMRELVDEQVSKMRTVIQSTFPKAVITTWSDYERVPEFQHCLQIVFAEYSNSKSFRNHCHSQTFQNLEPVLRNKGVTRKSHPVVASLSSYLLRELALLIYVERRVEIEGFVAPRSEMSIQTSISVGKYPNLAALCPAHKKTFVVP